MAVVVVGTLAGTFWYRALLPSVSEAGGSPAVFAAGSGAPAANGFGGFGGPGRPEAVLAAAPGSFPDFASVVSSLRGTVVSVGRSRVASRFGLDRAAAAGGGGEAPAANGAAAGAAGGDGTLQFAVPAAAAVLESIGTGFVVRSDGYILTNYHVVRGNDAMVVTVFDETGAQRYPATIVKLDASVDLALLKIEPRAPLSAAPLGDSDRVQVADEVIAIGSPFGLDLTVSRGIVSAKRKSLVIEGTVHRDLLQTDAAINQGNSGGPLVSRLGEVIGINTAIYTPTGAFAGVGFAVPSNQARLFLSDELGLQAGLADAGGDGPWGRPAAVPAAVPPGGAAMAAPPIVAGAPAPHRDGREKMDCAICHRFIGGGGGAATGIPAAVPPGGAAMAAPPIVAGTPAPHRDGREKMDCAICHRFIGGGGGAATGIPAAAPGTGLSFARPPTTLALNVAVPPAGGPAGAAPVASGFLILGAQTLPVTAALGAQIGQPEGKGVFVASVVPGSPAAVAGLEAGMVIEKADGRRLRTPRELFAVVEAAKTGDRLRLAVSGTAGRQELYLTVSVLPAAAGPVAPTVPTAAAPAPVPTEFNWRGMEIETFAAVAGAPAGGVAVKGAVVAEVVPGSPAQRAGVQANDIILEVGGLPTGSAALMQRAVQAATGRREVVMRMSRSNREFYVAVP